jgi:hypothetical protein
VIERLVDAGCEVFILGALTAMHAPEFFTWLLSETAGNLRPI